jgi:hypothetical protein
VNSGGGWVGQSASERHRSIVIPFWWPLAEEKFNSAARRTKHVPGPPRAPFHKTHATHRVTRSCWLFPTTRAGGWAPPTRAREMCVSGHDGRITHSSSALAPEMEARASIDVEIEFFLGRCAKKLESNSGETVCPYKRSENHVRVQLTS